MDRPSKLGAAIAILAVVHLVAFFVLNESPVWFNSSLFVASKVEALTGALPRLLVAFVFTIGGLAIAAAIAEQESRIAAAIFLLVSMFEVWARIGQLFFVMEQGFAPPGALLLGMVVSIVALIIALVAMWTTIRRR